MDVPRLDRFFWLATLALALTPCLAMAATSHLWPPGALPAPRAARAPRAPPPQLVLPASSAGWSREGAPDLLGFRNRFGDSGVPIVLLPAQAGPTLPRSPARSRAPLRSLMAYARLWRTLAFDYSMRHEPGEVSLLAEVQGCHGTAAVLRPIEVLHGELTPLHSVDDRLKCTQDGDDITLRRLTACFGGTFELRHGDVIPLQGDDSLLWVGIDVVAIRPAEIPAFRRLVRASSTKPRRPEKWR